MMMTKSCSPFKSCQNKPHKGTSIGKEDEDRLSELPDEILLSMISSFTVKETTALRLVSRRCEYICRCVPVLIFEDSRAMENIWENKTAVAEERPYFVRWVDSIIEEYLWTVVDELRITFDLDKNWQCHVDKWAAFALDKHVKRLELNFSSRWRNTYVVRNGLLSPICDEPLDLPPKFAGINSSITSLCLKYVNVTDELMDYISHSCPLLEYLCIVGSKSLTRVSGSLKKVKYLEVAMCCNLKTINISAPKLCSFVHNNEPADVHIADATSLTEVSIGMHDSHYRGLAFVVDSLSQYFSQLVYLNLRIVSVSKLNLEIDNPPALPNLQHLEMQVVAYVERSLRGWTSLIAASPSLHKLTLKLSGLLVKYHDWPIRKWVGFPLKSLKTLEILGYVGTPIDLELAFFVFENASMLEDVIVDFVPLNRKRYDDNVPRRLELLQMKLPQAVKLFVKQI